MSKSLVHVTSSNVDAVGYDTENNYLYVRYKNGTMYQYDKVPVEVYDGIFKTESVGRYLNENVKNKFHYIKFTEQELNEFRDFLNELGIDTVG